MTKKRQDMENTTDNEEQHLKKQKLSERSSPSPPQLGFDNALLPLATYDEEEDGDDGSRQEESSRSNIDEEEDRSNGFGDGMRNRTIEIRRDCPYLDTVNRQAGCDMGCVIGRLKSVEIVHTLIPLIARFNKDQVLQLDRNRQWSRALDGSDYLPGMLGLNNIKETDFVNVTIQSLMRVTPLRNFFLIPENYKDSKSVLVHRFGELTRKIWQGTSKDRFDRYALSMDDASKKRFRIGAQSDPVEFMSWLLNTLHTDLKSSRTKKSIIHQCFQGELEVVKEINGAEVSRMPFLMLGLDLPPPPLFKDVMEKNIIPQVPLFNILKKGECN
ncbi:hypothetical protein L1987_60527 [Smallanthus sonchifolius]|uniref:Uncharacterized protein n=1 Tax=Smallanthus sonchifolius TaxID=185202 RepID=A0ACB9D8J6_9ASTR|nr:hypothetical protein L1987_60527 [Smallanthus sonchifolius]